MPRRCTVMLLLKTPVYQHTIYPLRNKAIPEKHCETLATKQKDIQFNGTVICSSQDMYSECLVCTICAMHTIMRNAPTTRLHLT